MVDALLWGGSGDSSVRVQIPFLAPLFIFKIYNEEIKKFNIMIFLII